MAAETPERRRKRRISQVVNALFWLGIFVAVVVWTESWGVWWVMLLEAMVPLSFGGYLHLVLSHGGTSAR